MHARFNIILLATTVIALAVRAAAQTDTNAAVANTVVTATDVAAQQDALYNQVVQFVQQNSDTLTRLRAQVQQNIMDTMVRCSQSLKAGRPREASPRQKTVADSLDNTANQLDLALKRAARQAAPPTGGPLIGNPGINIRTSPTSIGINIGGPRRPGQASAPDISYATNLVDQLHAFAKAQRDLSAQSLSLAQFATPALTAARPAVSPAAANQPPAASYGSTGAPSSPGAGVAANGVNWTPPLETSADVAETPIGPTNSGKYVISGDEMHIAWIGEKDDGKCVYLDGVPGKVYNEITLTSPTKPTLGARMAGGGGVGAGSADGGSVIVYRARSGRDWFTVVGTNEMTGDNTLSLITYSPNSKHMAYFAGKKGETKWTFYLDGKPGPTYENAGNAQISFNRDGQHYAYCVNNTVFLDGKEVSSGGEVPRPAGPRFAFSFDGQHLAYIWSAQGKQFVVCDGQKGKDFPSVGALMFLGTNGPVSYIGESGFAVRVIGNMESSPYNLLGHSYIDSSANVIGNSVFGRPSGASSGVGQLFTTPDGRHFAYRATKDDGRHWVMVVDGKEGLQNEWIGKGEFSADGAHFAYVALRENKYVVVMDGKDGKEYDFIGEIALSPDGKRLAMFAALNKKAALILDGQELPLGDINIGLAGENRLEFTRDSKHVTCSARVFENGNFTSFSVANYLDGKYAGPILRVSRDGTHIASVGGAPHSEQCVTLDGVAGPGWNSIPNIMFSPNSEHLAYLGVRTGFQNPTRFVRLPTPRCCVVLDGKGGPIYDRFADEGQFGAFSDDHTFCYFAERNGKLYRVTQSAPGASATAQAK